MTAVSSCVTILPCCCAGSHHARDEAGAGAEVPLPDAAADGMRAPGHLLHYDPSKIARERRNSAREASNLLWGITPPLPLLTAAMYDGDYS